MSAVLPYRFNSPEYVEIARQYGELVARLVSHVSFWTRKNAEKETGIHDGFAWTYDCYQAIAKWLKNIYTPSQVRRGVAKAVEAGLIIREMRLTRSRKLVSHYRLADAQPVAEVEEQPDFDEVQEPAPQAEKEPVQVRLPEVIDAGEPERVTVRANAPTQYETAPKGYVWEITRKGAHAFEACILPVQCLISATHKLHANWTWTDGSAEALDLELFSEWVKQAQFRTGPFNWDAWDSFVTENTKYLNYYLQVARDYKLSVEELWEAFEYANQ
ncbi:hypothetical protein KTD13_01970 [Burkholderia multivorans]|uniref:hypothetical protein n=1 Tax=Burkholderia multivorans TaxID=87883 RepID=UPI001C24117C|nr:hypothetical protein [Burkholderia multivorans]MBU9259114.1 hypothetical protein [Burkholderia multivorans]